MADLVWFLEHGTNVEQAYYALDWVRMLKAERALADDLAEVLDGFDRDSVLDGFTCRKIDAVLARYREARG